MTNADKMNLKENDIIYRVTTNIFGEVVIETCKVASDNYLSAFEFGKMDAEKSISLIVYINNNLIILNSTEPIFTDCGKAIEYKIGLMKFRNCYKKLKKKGVIG